MMFICLEMELKIKKKSLTTGLTNFNHKSLLHITYSSHIFFFFRLVFKYIRILISCLPIPTILVCARNRTFDTTFNIHITLLVIRRDHFYHASFIIRQMDVTANGDEIKNNKTFKHNQRQIITTIFFHFFS